MSQRTLIAVACLVLTAAAAYAAQTATFRVHAPGSSPATVSKIHADLVRVERRIERALGEFPGDVDVWVHPSRAAFSDALEQAWGIPETACWMVGAADDTTLHLLSPDVWTGEACEHDPDDAEHVRRIIAHEAVHAYHGQLNPSEDVGLLEEIGWFTEGLATYASGQLGARHAGRAAVAVREGRAPDRLADAWSGPDRYGVAGSMVAFIHDAWGRETLRGLLIATSQTELLDELGMSEPEFLARWKDWALGDSAS